MASVKLEFDVDMTCETCANSIRSTLKNKGIHDIIIDLSSKKVVINTCLSIVDVLDAIESTGSRAALKGCGTEASRKLGNAVVELKESESIMGVVRFMQLNEDVCLIEGTIDGLKKGEHGLHIYEYGDISCGCENLGDHFNPTNTSHGGPDDVEKHYGDLGNIFANEAGRSTFRFENMTVKTWDIIGRSLAVCAEKDDYGKGDHSTSKIDGNCGKRLTCGIIARSAGLFQNSKQFCACDGVSVWNERDLPNAGASRAQHNKVE